MATSSNKPAGKRPPKGFLTRLTFWLSMFYLVGLVLAAVAIWKFGDIWWPATVLLFSPRWALALPLVVLLPLSLFKSRRSLITLTVAAVLLAWPIMGLRISKEPAEQSRAPFVRVLTCNIHRRALNTAEFKTLIDELRPDVIALQDWSSTHENELFGGIAWHIRRDGEIFIASRYPIIESRNIDLEKQPKPDWKIREGAAVYYHLQTPLGPVNLINLHLSSPHEGLQSLREFESNAPEQVAYNSRARDLESASIERFARRIKGPLVIVGDFNTPSESSVYWTHWNGLVDAFDVRGSGFGVTHVSAASSVRIDHILLGAGWDVRQCWLGKASGSPHRPLVADLQLTDAPASRIARLDP